jgi:hypothetical protein
LVVERRDRGKIARMDLRMRKRKEKCRMQMEVFFVSLKNTKLQCKIGDTYI